MCNLTRPAQIGSTCPFTPMEGLATLDTLYDSVEVDSECLDVLIPYLDKLLALGIDFTDVDLQQAIEGYIYHLEPACQALIAHAGLLATQGQRFSERTAATEAFSMALAEAWQPPPHWADFLDSAALARYISPYEQALRWIYMLQAQGHDSRWQAADLEILADAEIAALLPQIERDYRQAQRDYYEESNDDPG
jgi:hypothetical protein